MVELQMEPEFYAWDWFVQLFMSLFSVPQSAILVDLLLSVNDGDLILICLSVALIGELRPIIMHNGFEKVMGVFKEMNENIPMVDFASVIRTTVMVYMTLPRSIQREFSRIDTLIEEGTIQEGYDYCSHPFHYEITAEELERLKRSDWKNLVFVDLFNALKTDTEECYKVWGSTIYNYSLDVFTSDHFQHQKDDIFSSLSIHKYRVIILIVRPSEKDANCQLLLDAFREHAFYRRFVFHSSALRE